MNEVIHKLSRNLWQILVFLRLYFFYKIGSCLLFIFFDFVNADLILNLFMSNIEESAIKVSTPLKFRRRYCFNVFFSCFRQFSKKKLLGVVHKWRHANLDNCWPPSPIVMQDHDVIIGRPIRRVYTSRLYASVFHIALRFRSTYVGSFMFMEANVISTKTENAYA